MNKQPEKLGLTNRILCHRFITCLQQSIGPWPSAIFGLQRKSRHETPEEKTLRDRVLLELKNSGLNRTRLARAIGVTRPFLSAALNGSVALPRAWLEPLGQALGVSKEQLLDGITLTRAKRRLQRKSAKQHPSNKALRLRLEELRRSRRLTLKQIATSIGVSHPAVSHVLTGRMALPPAWITPLAHLFDLSENKLLAGTAWKPHKRRLTNQNG